MRWRLVLSPRAYCGVELGTVRVSEIQTGSSWAELAGRGLLFGQHTYFSFVFKLNAFRQIVCSSINLAPIISTLLHFWSLAWRACVGVCDAHVGGCFLSKMLWGPFLSQMLWFGDKLYFFIIVPSWLAFYSHPDWFSILSRFLCIWNIIVWDSIL